MFVRCDFYCYKIIIRRYYSEFIISFFEVIFGDVFFIFKVCFLFDVLVRIEL